MTCYDDRGFRRADRARAIDNDNPASSLVEQEMVRPLLIALVVICSLTDSGSFAAHDGAGPSSVTIIGPAFFPDSTNSLYYSPITVTASGGTAPYTCAIDSGVLPTGVSDSSECVYSGFPSAVGTYHFAIRVTDATGATAAHAYQATINPLASIPFDATNPVLYLNDNGEDSYHDEYMEALSAAGTIDLVGMVRNATVWPDNVACGPQCTAQAADRIYSLGLAAQTAARNSWYKNRVSCAIAACFPTLMSGSPWGHLAKPASGIIDDTAALNEAGARLIVRQAALATYAKPLVIVVGGPITPVADAYLLDHSIVDKVIIAFEGGNGVPTFGRFSFVEYNAVTDPWASYICAMKFRMVVTAYYPDPPAGVPRTPKSRMSTDVPDAPIKTAMLSRDFTRYNQPTENNDVDSPVGIAVMNPPGWVTGSVTASVDGTVVDPGTGYEVPHFSPDANGRIFYIYGADSRVSSTVWWNALLNPRIWEH